jgi:hypothetical protein
MAMIALLLARRNRKLSARTPEEAILKWLVGDFEMACSYSRKPRTLDFRDYLGD